MHTIAVLYSKVTVLGLSLAVLVLIGPGLGAPIRKARDTISDSTIADIISGYDVIKTYANNTDISPKPTADMGFRGPLCDLLAYRDLIAIAVARDTSSSTPNSNMTKLLTLLNRTAEDACLVYQNLTNAQYNTNDATSESQSTCSLGSQEMTMFRVSCMSTRLHSIVDIADKSTEEWCELETEPGQRPCNRYPCTWTRKVFQSMESYAAVKKVLIQHQPLYCFFDEE